MIQVFTVVLRSKREVIGVMLVLAKDLKNIGISVQSKVLKFV
jgi:hypothetical protein